MCKAIKEKIMVTNYVYVVLPDKKICIELEDMDKAKAYAKAFGGEVREVFPYAEYGFEDPYTFTNEWTILVNYGDKVEYEIDGDTVKEVHVQ